ncbi:hypothetical protein FACS1894186_0870 [Alphaproteobacteria bacterium]|nr:hypothetical protein FACS1894186_0870 [Alphaproteobacteria bacterium]
MFQLMQHLVAFKYACKLNHWRTDDYAQHLLFDRLQEDLDDLVDNVAERVFMAHGRKEELTAAILAPDAVNPDLRAAADEIDRQIDRIFASGKLTEGDQSLLSGVEEAFQGKLALINMK